jgi:hypothetical protein
MSDYGASPPEAASAGQELERESEPIRTVWLTLAEYRRLKALAGSSIPG